MISKKDFEKVDDIKKELLETIDSQGPIKVLILNSDENYESFLKSLDIPIKISKEYGMGYVELLVLTGGEDVSPDMYGDIVHKTTYCNKERDTREQSVYNSLYVPTLGHCRGSQLLGVLNGGSLIQNMRHPGVHKIKTITGEEFNVNSTHHQMQWPFDMDKSYYTIIGYAENLSPYLQQGDNTDMRYKNNVEPEIVLYHRDNNKIDLAIQGHPEYPNAPKEFVEYCKNLIIITVFKNILQNRNLKSSKKLNSSTYYNEYKNVVNQAVQAIQAIEVPHPVDPNGENLRIRHLQNACKQLYDNTEWSEEKEDALLNNGFNLDNEFQNVHRRFLNYLSNQGVTVSLIKQENEVVQEPPRNIMREQNNLFFDINNSVISHEKINQLLDLGFTPSPSEERDNRIYYPFVTNNGFTITLYSENEVVIQRPRRGRRVQAVPNF